MTVRALVVSIILLQMVAHLISFLLHHNLLCWKEKNILEIHTTLNFVIAFGYAFADHGTVDNYNCATVGIDATTGYKGGFS